MFWTTATLLVTLAFARVSTSTMAGAITDTDVNIPEVKDALNFAVDEFNTQSNDVYIYKVVQVIKATSQVVSGTMYRFEVEMVISGYKSSPQEMCAMDNSELKKPYTCYFEVWSQPWLGPPKLMKKVCKN
ncbi:cystatin-like isoform X2 [Alosa pseudoharengus]|uniref:cystatin-like isoform X2 n=1 Tax=Alosa pseudoharengus TaxID=34774 RepID=UPI003F89FDB2